MHSGGDGVAQKIDRPYRAVIWHVVSVECSTQIRDPSFNCCS